MESSPTRVVLKLALPTKSVSYNPFGPAERQNASLTAYRPLEQRACPARGGTRRDRNALSFRGVPGMSGGGS